MSDIGSVTSYATDGLRLWAAPLNRHGRLCPCLICGDTRKYLGLPALVPDPVSIPLREDRAS